jgi:hypothetical protein
VRSLDANGLGLFDSDGVCVSRLSRKGNADWGEKIGSIREIRVLAMVARTAAQDEDQSRREQYLVAEWEVPLVEVVRQVSPE